MQKRPSSIEFNEKKAKKHSVRYFRTILPIVPEDRVPIKSFRWSRVRNRQRICREERSHRLFAVKTILPYAREEIRKMKPYN